LGQPTLVQWLNKRSCGKPQPIYNPGLKIYLTVLDERVDWITFFVLPLTENMSIEVNFKKCPVCDNSFL
jgi:hypothetical protein